MSSPASVSFGDALDLLRDTVLRIAPTGDDGFEGLVAGVVAELTGLTFRLAKSGSQFGRDASTTPGLYEISLECKRYSQDELRLEVLAGKAMLAAELRVDLWIIGTTSTVGDDTLVKLQPHLEKSGISVVCLDWTLHPMPPLAVAMAAARTKTFNWFRPHCSSMELLAIDDALAAVAAHPMFASQEETLRDQLSAASVGLDALRKHSAQWLRDRFDQPSRSQQAFGQIIRRSSAATATVIRRVPLELFDAAVNQQHSRSTVVAIVGEEGTGKTWLIAQWWSLQAAPPIVVLVSGRRVRALSADDPLGSLARLLAQQDGPRLTDQEWRARLERWKLAPSCPSPRFVVVLDGLNEHPETDWADVTSALAREVHALGGTVVVSTRPGYWRRNVEPQLGADISKIVVAVVDYDDAELDAALRHGGITPSVVPAPLRAFMRNPRVCGVACNIVMDLSVQPDTLTVERLLFHYWRSRLKERGNLVGHREEDLAEVLRSHAEAFLRTGEGRFDENQWAKHSGAASRRGREAVAGDLEDIIEGRFLRPAAGPPGMYEFRPDALPFALGLLVTHELWSSDPKTDMAADETAQRILEPVQGFDTVSDVAAAAVGLASFNPEYPDVARRALIRAWFGLQNKTENAWRAITAHFLDYSDPFLDVVEVFEVSPRLANSDGSLPGLILANRFDSRAAAAIRARIPRWLTRWSRVAPEFAEPSAFTQRFKADFAARIDAAWGALNVAERELFARLTGEQSVSKDLHYLAVLLMAGGPIEPFTEALLGWTLTQHVARPMHGVGAELAWILRFNSLDPVSVQESVRALAVANRPGCSEIGGSVLADLLRRLGDKTSSAFGEDISPRSTRTAWHRREQFSAVDPFDPSAAAPEDLNRARSAIAAVNPENVHTSMGQTRGELDLDFAIPPLARFDPETLIEFARRVVQTAETRDGPALRQLTLELLDMAPAFDEASRSSIRTALRRVLDGTVVFPNDERRLLTWFLFAAAALEMPPLEQRRLMAELPDAPIPTAVLSSITSLPIEAFELQINDDIRASDRRALALTCLFAPTGPTALSAETKAVLLDAVFSSDEVLSRLAAAAVETLEDSSLDAEILDRATREVLRRRDSYIEGLVGALSVRSGKFAALERLSMPTLGWVAEHRSEALTTFADKLDQTLGALLSPIAVIAPGGLQLHVHVGDDVRDISQTVSATASSERAALDASAQYPGDGISAQQAMIDQAQAYERALEEVDAAALLAAPNLECIQKVVDADVTRAGVWLGRILRTSDRRVLRQVRNLALGLGGAFARHDHTLASQVISYVADVSGAVSIVFGGDKIPLWSRVVFSVPPIGRFAEWRLALFDEAFSDADLEEAVVAVDAVGESAWLDGYLEQGIGSTTPAVQARALTAAGLRAPNAHSDDTLDRDWGRGFLGDVAVNARKQYSRARWASTWLLSAAAATSGSEYWRFGLLAERIADRRIFATLRSDRVQESRWLDKYGFTLFERLTRAQKNRTDKRKKTLFGHQAPDRDVISVLRRR